MPQQTPDDNAQPPAIRLDRFENASFDRGASKAVEVAWLLLRAFLFLHPIPLPSSLKITALRLFGAKIGTGVVIRSGVKISFPWRLTVGDHVWIGDDVNILSLAEVTIGSHVCISQQAFLCTGSHDFRSESFDLITKPITISSHSWVAARAFITPGTVIPPQTMLRANATITPATYQP